MQTDTLFQLIDRQAIAKLKAFHYRREGRVEEADTAEVQAEELAVAGDAYVYECMTGKRKPQAMKHLRYHDHHKAQKEEAPQPGSIMECSSMIAETHYTYWGLQSVIQELKKGNRSEWTDATFVDLQLQIDKCNMDRNHLIQTGDQLFAEMFE